MKQGDVPVLKNLKLYLNTCTVKKYSTSVCPRDSYVPRGLPYLKSSEDDQTSPPPKPLPILKGPSFRPTLLGTCWVVPGRPPWLRVPPLQSQELAGPGGPLLSSPQHSHCRGGQSTLPWWCTGKQSALQTGCCRTEWSRCWALPSRAGIWSHWGRCGRVPLSHMEPETHPECHLWKERGERQEKEPGRKALRSRGPGRGNAVEKRKIKWGGGSYWNKFIKSVKNKPITCLHRSIHCFLFHEFLL